jgi:uridylate kinase
MPVSQTDLRRLTGTTKTDDELSLFCEMGQFSVDEFLSTTDLTDIVKGKIALYLAGHFYVLSVEGGGITYSKSGQAEEKYKSFGYDTIGFAVTRFGQMACSLDTSNVLMDMSNKDKISFAVESYSSPRANTRLGIVE